MWLKQNVTCIHQQLGAMVTYNIQSDCRIGSHLLRSFRPVLHHFPSALALALQRTRHSCMLTVITICVTLIDHRKVLLDSKLTRTYDSRCQFLLFKAIRWSQMQKTCIVIIINSVHKTLYIKHTTCTHKTHAVHTRYIKYTICTRVHTQSTHTLHQQNSQSVSFQQRPDF